MRAVVAIVLSLLAASAFAQGSASLSWTDPTQNTDGTPAVITGHRVYWGPSAGVYPNAVTIGATPNYVVSPLAAGTWYFVVAALNSAGESMMTAPGSKTIPAATVFAPNAPTNFSMTFTVAPSFSVIGDDTQGTGQYPSSLDRALVTCYAASMTGTIQRAGAWFAAATGSQGMNAKAVVYANVGGTPGARIAVSSAAPVPAAGGKILFPLSGTIDGPVCVGIVADGFQVAMSTESTTTDALTVAFALSYTNPPAVWPSSVTYQGSRLDAWIEVGP